MAHHVTFQGSLAFSALVALLLIRSETLAPLASIFYTTSAGLLSWITYRTFIYPFYFSPLRHVPTVPGCPLWGHALARLTNEFRVPEREWHRKYGLVVRYFLPFGIERLIIADEEAIKHVTTKKPYDFVKAPFVTNWIKGILGENGVLLVEGDVHVRQRKVLAPAFSTSAIRDLERLFFAKGLLLVSVLEKSLWSVPGGQCVEILTWVNRATLDVIGTVAFDYDVDSLRNPETPLHQAYSAIFAFDLTAVVVMALRLYIDAVRYVPFKMNRAFDSSCQVVTDIASDVVNSKLDSGLASSAKKDVISLVMRHNKSLPESERLSFEDIRDQVKTVLAAGHDTTATGVAWTIDLLSKHPDMQGRLREEILSTIPSLADGECDPEALSQENVLDRMPYLNNVCQESLRFIPPIPIVVRKSIADSTLGGYFVPGGTLLYITSHAINRLEHYWGKDADRFDPDRWDRLPKQWVPTAYQTFLQGPRGCVGRRFAETEMKVFLCCLLARFRFERDEQWPDQENRKMWRLVLRPKDGISVKMSPVNSSSSPAQM